MDAPIQLFVVGAHLTGMPLNAELQALGATLVKETRTATDYKFFVLPNTTPPKPGLLRVPQSCGPGIAGEIWALSPDAFGRFVAKIPAPLGIGKILMEDGAAVSGFLCEAYATKDAKEITNLGGWRSYLASV